MKSCDRKIYTKTKCRRSQHFVKTPIYSLNILENENDQEQICDLWWYDVFLFIRQGGKWLTIKLKYAINRLTLSRLWYFFGSSLFSSQKLLDSLCLTRHFWKAQKTMWIESRPRHKSIGKLDVTKRSHMIGLVLLCCHNWRCHRLVLYNWRVKWNEMMH